jgi:hypothetical protein
MLSPARWHFTELADKLQGVEATFLRHALNFWVNHGVLREDLNGNYELLEKAEDVAGEGGAELREYSVFGKNRSSNSTLIL